MNEWDLSVKSIKSRGLLDVDCFGRIYIKKQFLVLAVEVVEFLANFGREARLKVCECPKFAKSTQGALKDEFTHESRS